MTHDEGDILAAPNSLDRLRGVRARAETDFADPLNGINQINSSPSATASRASARR